VRAPRGSRAHPAYLLQAALTSARTSGASIYTPPPLQSALDIQSGILHAEEKDYKTAYSYFFEAFEAQASAASFAPPVKAREGEGADGAVPASSGEQIDTEGKGALEALKYMLLCKVMLNLVRSSFLRARPVFYSAQPEDVHSLLSIKLALKYAQLRDVESMRAIARAHQDRNLADFEKALRDYKDGAAHSFSTRRAYSHTSRAILGPDDPVAPRGAVRHAARAEPAAHRRAVLCRRAGVRQRVRRPGPPGGRGQVSAVLIPSTDTVLTRTQALADDPGQGVPRRPRSGTRVPTSL
jgi:hypothetical protein